MELNSRLCVSRYRPERNTLFMWNLLNNIVLSQNHYLGSLWWRPAGGIERAAPGEIIKKDMKLICLRCQLGFRSASVRFAAVALSCDWRSGLIINPRCTNVYVTAKEEARAPRSPSRSTRNRLLAEESLTARRTQFTPPLNSIRASWYQSSRRGCCWNIYASFWWIRPPVRPSAINNTRLMLLLHW